MAMEDDGKGKWVWGALGIAAGAGIAYWLLKRKGLLLDASSAPALPAPVAAQQPAAGTEGMMAAYAVNNQAKAPAPARTTDIVDAEFTAVNTEEDDGEF